MNKFDKKAEKIQAHLSDHPADYQSVVSLFVAESCSIEFEKRLKKNKVKAQIAKIKKGGSNNEK
ncbi:hypothetical protein ACYSNR_00865 [Enterococcus sp. LJL128]